MEMALLMKLERLKNSDLTLVLEKLIIVGTVPVEENGSETNKYGNVLNQNSYKMKIFTYIIKYETQANCHKIQAPLS